MADKEKYIGVITTIAGKYVNHSPKKNWEWGVTRWFKQQSEWDWTSTVKDENNARLWRNANYEFRIVPLVD